MTRRACRNRAWEATLLGVHAAAYLTAVFLVLSPAKAVAFIVVQQGLFGFYLACSFAPNHKGMPILPASDKSGFLRRQVLTSRNVRGGWLTDFALGGLNYQIEHHLFPSMPRPSLRRSQALIAAFCAEHDVPYCQASLPGSYAQVLRYLNVTGKLAAQVKPAPHHAGRARLVAGRRAAEHYPAPSRNGSSVVDDVGVMAKVHPGGVHRPNAPDRGLPGRQVGGLAGRQLLAQWPGVLARRVGGVPDQQVG